MSKTKRYLRYIGITLAVLAVVTAVLIFLGGGPQEGAFVYQVH